MIQFFLFSFTCIDGPSIAVNPTVSAYKTAYGSSYYSAPKVAITPAVSKVIAAPAVATYTSGLTPTISSYVAPAKVAYAAHSPAISSYYAANKLAYSSTPSLTASYVSPQTYSTAYASNYGSSYGIAKAAYSVAPAAKYVSTAYTNPSYVATNKFGYNGPNVAPHYAASYVSAPIAKHVTYASNPLLHGSAYVSGYKSGAAYVSPVATTATLGGAGILKTAGYSSLGYMDFLD